MTPVDWNVLLAPTVPWQDAYATVEREARRMLTAYLEPAATVSTTHLADMLYPPDQMRGEAGIAARARIFKALAALAEKGLSDCASRGAPMQKKAWRAGKLQQTTVRPWLWHAPREKQPGTICPHCGKDLF